MADANLKLIISAIDKATPELKRVSGSLGSLASQAAGVLAAGGAVAALGAAAKKIATEFREAVDATVAYDKSIRDMSANLMIGTQETSRLIQVADDYGISINSLETAMQMALKNGFAPSIESLAKLADEYNAISDPTERAAKMTELFGRQWTTLTPMLKEGGDAIRELAKSQSSALIQTRENVTWSRLYEKATDDLDDKFQGLRYTMVNGLMPAMVSVSQLAGASVDELTKLLVVSEAFDGKPIGLQVRSTELDLSGTESIIEKTKAELESAVTSENLTVINSDLASQFGDLTVTINGTTRAMKSLVVATDPLYMSYSELSKAMSGTISKMTDFGYSSNYAKYAADSLRSEIENTMTADERLKADIDIVNQAFLAHGITLEEYRVHLASAAAGTFGLSDAERETMQAAIDHAAAVRGDAEAAASLAANASAAASAQYGLAESLKGASQAQIASVFIDMVADSEQLAALYGDELTNVVMGLGLQFGLVTPQSVAMADALTWFNDAVTKGYMPVTDMNNAFSVLNGEAADGSVNYNNLASAIFGLPGAVNGALPPLGDMETMTALLAGDALAAHYYLDSIFSMPEYKKIEIELAVTGDKLPNIIGSNYNVGINYRDMRQHGGPVYGRQTYLVGEAGPELFVPSGAGRIIPNENISAGGGQTVNVYFTYSPAVSLGNQYEVEKVLAPIIRDTVRTIR